jgi:hypothetical protein
LRIGFAAEVMAWLLPASILGPAAAGGKGGFHRARSLRPKAPGAPPALPPVKKMGSYNSFIKNKIEGCSRTCPRVPGNFILSSYPYFCHT